MNAGKSAWERKKSACAPSFKRTFTLVSVTNHSYFHFVESLSHSVSDLRSLIVSVPRTAVLDVRLLWVSSQITGAFLRRFQSWSFFSLTFMFYTSLLHN